MSAGTRPARGRRLDGRVAIVTGAGSGIGRAIALRFAAEGARVVVADIQRARAEETVAQVEAAQGTAWPFVADIADERAVPALVAVALEREGRLDILVNNAAIAKGTGLLGLEPSTWDENLALDLRAPYLCMRAAIPPMIAARRGAIVNIGSVNGLLGLGEYAYSAAKAGLISLTRNAAVEFGPAGIRVNAICPGTVRTPIWQERLAADPQILERLTPWYPLGRIGEPDEIAAAALFLASDDASFVTGAVLVVDGGLTAGMGRMLDDLAGRPPGVR
jgi:NAD(P)-dependent dehydrogenase (short-subunit alcohol dehydrogenase family)